MNEPPIDKEYYDRSDYFDARTGHLRDVASRFQRYRLSKVLELYSPAQEERVLDLGCGWGTFSFTLAPMAQEVVGLDFSERSIELCQERLTDSPRRNLSFVCADAADTGLAPESFDVVYAADLFEHVYPDDSDRVMAEVARLLKPGGRLVVWTPHRGHIIEILKNRGIVLRRDPTHVDYKSMDRLRASLTTAGFFIEKAYYAESHLPVFNWIERSFLSSVPMLRRRIAILARRK